MARVDIVRADDGTVEFRPSPITVQAGDTVFWRNLDPKAQHWITKRGEARTFWFPSPLARFVDGQPAAVTSGVLINGNIGYECGLHPEAQGEIRIG